MRLMERREFLAAGILAAITAPVQSSIEVEVMEVFSSLSGPSALLVHHIDEPTREAFATWLRRNSGKEIVFQSRGKTPIDGRVFRVSLCFGRGLILSKTPQSGVRAKDRLSVHLK
jgi:hypothetical protein